MNILKCKMCGGTIEFNAKDTIGTCDSCGTKQTLPRIDGEKRANLYDRANHFRRANDYDKAANLFNQILNDDPKDSEGYWSLVLCKYGIEYVKDPKSEERVPTVNRSQFTSIFQDENYKAAIKYADEYQKEIYESEAKVIDEIQNKILDISKKEAPFDVFISYKESDADGRRTVESVLATDLYEQLIKEGFKVFLSRITLEDKLGTAYEPYIFAALNSSKVMVVIGTNRQNYDAVWVKNEWSRFLALIASGENKVLIPAYRDMDPYDLPDEFSHLQAQDMSKLGFMQDLVRGIKKIIGVEKVVNEDKQLINSGIAVEPLITRAKMFIEDGDWKKAEDICEQALNIEPQNGRLYTIKLLIDFKLKNLDELVDKGIDVSGNVNYEKAIKFSEGNDKKIVEETRKRALYTKASELYRNGNSEENLKKALEAFELIIDYEDSAVLASDCSERLDNLQKNRLIAKKKNAKRIIVAEIVVLAIVLSLILYKRVYLPNKEKSNSYKDAIEYMENEDYDNAMEIFESLEDYNDSIEKYEECAIKSHDKKSKEIEDIKNQTIDFINSEESQIDDSDEKKILTYISQLKTLVSEYGFGNSMLNDVYIAYGRKSLELEQYLNADKYYSKAGAHGLFLNELKKIDGAEEKMKYDYIKENWSYNNGLTRSYFEDLIKENFPGINEEFKKFKSDFPLKIHVHFYSDGRMVTKISKYETLGVSYSIEQGYVEGQIFSQTTFPDGYIGKKEAVDIPYGDSSLVWEWQDGIWKNPEAGATGTLRVEFFDDRGNIIGSAKCEITD